MARVIRDIKHWFEGYEKGKHYLRGIPGPKAAEKAAQSSLSKTNGGNSRLVVASSDLTRVSPDARRS